MPPLKNNSPPSGPLYGLHTATACSRFCLGISAAWSAVADRRCIILPGSGWFLELFCFFLSFFLGMEPDLSALSQPAKASLFTFALGFQLPNSPRACALGDLELKGLMDSNFATLQVPTVVLWSWNLKGPLIPSPQLPNSV